MIDNIVIEGFILLYMGSSIYLFFKEIDEEKHKEDFRKHMNKIYGGKIMFDKKEMKLVKFEQIRKYFANGEKVFMVMEDGQLVEMDINTDWQLLFFHQLRGGAVADLSVYPGAFPVRAGSDETDGARAGLSQAGTRAGDNKAGSTPNDTSSGLRFAT